ncbi:hypothetical protein E2C01_010672 [Portunus trituberculatus]|uniref:Uncharacterized protein n=1 Tax=Portunus trituberculatus TaxID=210409 RepID=A0A5B7D9D5_PORTR|nr:hypothetical protein [Portunus trituberculatus]
MKAVRVTMQAPTHRYSLCVLSAALSCQAASTERLQQTAAAAHGKLKFNCSADDAEAGPVVHGDGFVGQTGLRCAIFNSPTTLIFLWSLSPPP